MRRVGARGSWGDASKGWLGRGLLRRGRLDPRCPELHAEDFETKELDAVDVEEAGVPQALGHVRVIGPDLHGFRPFDGD
ncbi:MAG: hypothetical protein JW767_10900 [Thermoleophilia bacterium]|nr:hypothetical protein [Thermoleophilia bacterium]